MILKQVIHYPDTNSVEATWVDENDIQVRCHSYADVQMDMLEADLGTDLSEHASLIATVRANIKPPYVPSQAELDAIESVKAIEELKTIDLASIRSIREYIASQQDAPQVLKDRETAAINLRTKIIK